MSEVSLCLGRDGQVKVQGDFDPQYWEALCVIVKVDEGWVLTLKDAPGGN